MLAPHHPRRVFAWLAVGLVGLVVFIWTVARFDPLGAARFNGQSLESVEAQGRALLKAHGVDLPADVFARVRQARSQRLTDSLWARHGAAQFRQEAPKWPWLRWRVEYAYGDGRQGQPRREFIVDFDGQGRLSWLVLPDGLETEARPDTAALREVGAPLNAESRPPSPDSLRVWEAQAVALARHHLRSSMFAGRTLRVDSTARGLPMTRRVHLRSADADGPPLYVEATVHRMGALVGLTWSVAPPGERGGNEGLDRAQRIIVTGLYLLLLLLSVIRFLLQLIRREVDLRAAFRDGVALGLVTMVFWGLSSFHNFRLNSFDLSVLVISFGINLLILGLLGMFVGMAASGSAEATLRPVLPRKLLTLELLRRGAWQDRRLGRAMLRGIATGIAVVATVALVSAATGLYLGSRPSSYLSLGLLVAPGLAILSWGVLFGVLFVLLLAVPVLRQGLPLSPARAVLLVAMGLLMGVLLRGLEGFVWDAEQILLLSLGVTAALLTARYDPLTAIAAFAFGLITWQMREFWLTGAAPPIDAWIVTVILPLALMAAAFVALFGTKQSDADAYVPEYMAEREERERMEHELAIAHDIQQRFLPQSMPRLPGLDAAAVCLPALEVGGDLYDFLDLGPGRLGVVVGDVSGKGTQAAFVMTLVKGAIQTLPTDTMAPADVLRRLNRMVRANVPRGVFVSMIYAVLDVPAQTLTVARAGHTPVVIRPADGSHPRLVYPPGVALGLADGAAFDRVVATETVHLTEGDVAVVYTDGFSEAMNAARDLYTDERLAEGISARPADSAQAVLDATLEDVQAFARGVPQHDDMTFVALRIV